jgi:transcriptional regulator with XRE-family HTH domain
VTLCPWPDIVDVMATDDPSDRGATGDNGPEGVFIGARLKELAHTLGLNQNQLAVRCGIDRRTFNPYWTDRRKCGLPTVIKIAKATGRSIAWLLGEGAARPVLGTVDAQGHLSMKTPMLVPGVLLLVDTTPWWPAGTQLYVDPTTAFVVDEYLVLQTRGGAVPWVCWAEERGGLRLLRRPSGEVVVYDERHHELLGLISGVLSAPSKPPSA